MKKFQHYDGEYHYSEMTGMIYKFSGIKEEPLTFRRYSFLTLMFLPLHVSELSQT